MEREGRYLVRGSGGVAGAVVAGRGSGAVAGVLSLWTARSGVGLKCFQNLAFRVCVIFFIINLFETASFTYLR